MSTETRIKDNYYIRTSTRRLSPKLIKDYPGRMRCLCTFGHFESRYHSRQRSTKLNFVLKLCCRKIDAQPFLNVTWNEHLVRLRFSDAGHLLNANVTSSSDWIFRYRVYQHYLDEHDYDETNYLTQMSGFLMIVSNLIKISLKTLTHVYGYLRLVTS